MHMMGQSESEQRKLDLFQLDYKYLAYLWYGKELMIELRRKMIKNRRSANQTAARKKNVDGVISGQKNSIVIMVFSESIILIITKKAKLILVSSLHVCVRSWYNIINNIIITDFILSIKLCFRKSNCVLFFFTINSYRRLIDATLSNSHFNRTVRYFFPSINLLVQTNYFETKIKGSIIA